MVLFPLPAHRTGQADFPHPALGKDAHRIEIRHVTPSATSEHNRGVARLIVNPRVLCRFLRQSLTEVPSLHRSYPASLVLRTSPPPHTARPVSRELSVDHDCDHRWGFPCCYWSTLPTCRRHYPGRSDGTRSLVLSHQRRPAPLHGGRAPALIVSRPAQRSLHVTACMLAKSPMRPSTPEAPTASFSPPPLRLLPGGANPVPGRDFHPQSTSTFPRRTVKSRGGATV